VRRVCRCGHTEDLHIEKGPEPKRRGKKKPERQAAVPVDVGRRVDEARPEHCRVFLPDRLTRGMKGIYCPCEGFRVHVADKPVVKTVPLTNPAAVLCEKCNLPLGPRSSRSTSTTHRRCAA